MKLGFIAVNDLSIIEQDAQFAVEHGFEGLEFNHWHNTRWSNFDAQVTDEYVAQVRDILAKYGAKVASFGLWGSNHISTDDEERQASLDRLERAIRFAETLGAEVLITGGGQIPGKNRSGRGGV